MNIGNKNIDIDDVTDVLNKLEIGQHWAHTNGNVENNLSENEENAVGSKNKENVNDELNK